MDEHGQRVQWTDDAEGPSARIGALLPARPWSDPVATGLGRLPIRPQFVPCPDVSVARAIDGTDPSTFSTSPWWVSLDGRWALDFDDGTGLVRSGSVDLPGAWTLQGFSSPHYTNAIMPFDLDPPAVPETNPAGIYRRTVTIPREWKGRRVVLRVGAAESFHAVIVDGALVGYGTDSRLPSEYDLTGAVRPGRRSVIEVAVLRWSAQSWVEDQDQWWHGGLQRSIALYSTAMTHLADVGLVPGLSLDDLAGGPIPADRAVTGTLSVEIQVATGPAQASIREAGWTVEVHVETERGRRLATTGALPVPAWNAEGEAAQLASAMFTQPGRVTAQLLVPRARAWSAESPTLYRAMVVLRDPRGEVVEATARRTGFRHVEVTGRELRINGAPVEICGVNHHEHDPLRGRAVDARLTRRDLELMKEHNLNAVRAAHYPHDEHFAEMCDELGLYVVDEANVESHGRQASLCDDPRYARTMVERVERMARRDRNHPSIVVWSLGNESGDGPPQAEAAAFLRRFDPSRPVQYEGPLMHDLYAEAPTTDVVCPMYTSIDHAVARARWPGDQLRPVILCEYSHAMGNSNGSLADYWDAIDSTPGFQGGFIWEWLEHGLEPVGSEPGRHLGPDGRTSWAYGGDFGDHPNDGNFVCDGLVSALREPHPALREVHHVGRPVRTEAIDAARGDIRISNRHWFRDTSDLVGRWVLTLDGRAVERGTVPGDAVAPRGARTVRLGYRRPVTERSAAAEAFVTVTWSLRRSTTWARSGHVVAVDQFPVALTAPGAAPRGVPRPDRSARAVGSAMARAPRARPAGLPVELRFEPTLFRALTDNDAIQTSWMREWSPNLERWSALAGTLPTALPDGVEAEVRLRPARHRAEGWWILDVRITIPDEHADVPRVGVVTHLPGTFDALEWFGDGPHESYPDRRASVTVGRWRSPVAAQYVPYAFPQEHGHHTDLRWLRLADPVDRVALEVVMDTPGVGFSARHHTDLELFRARHAGELSPLAAPELTELHLGWVRGLGTGSCGPDTLPEYRLGAGRYRFRARLRWITHR